MLKDDKLDPEWGVEIELSGKKKKKNEVECFLFCFTCKVGS